MRGLGLLFIPEWNVSIKSLLSEFRESLRSEGGKSVRARENAGCQEKIPLNLVSQAHMNSQRLSQHTQGLHRSSMASTLVFYGIPECTNKCISDSCVLGSFPFVGLPYPISI